MTWAIVVAAWLVATVAASALFVAHGMRRAKRMHGQEILKTITEPGGVESFRVPAGVKVWNPASPPSPTNGISGPGHATYRLENNEVHLTFVKEGAAALEIVGPVPALDDMQPWLLGRRKYGIIARQLRQRKARGKS